MTALVLATANPGKLQELQELLAAESALAGQDLAQLVACRADFPGAPEVIEDGDTFAANALLKARALAKFTGHAALADDSGLSADILGGAPGIFSARWSGRHGADQANLELLLAQLGDVRPEHRGAQFECAVALVRTDGTSEVRHGVLRGTLSTAPRGVQGFGYDPIFEVAGRTLAEHSAVEKNAISHRALALRAIVPELLPLLLRDR